MPNNGKIKPRVKINKVREMILYVDNKRYSVCLCDKCCLKIYEHRNKKNDHSEKARYGYNRGSNNRVKNIGLANNSGYYWLIPVLELFGQKKLTCDFCSGKYNLEYFMKP